MAASQLDGTPFFAEAPDDSLVRRNPRVVFGNEDKFWSFCPSERDLLASILWRRAAGMAGHDTPDTRSRELYHSHDDAQVWLADFVSSVGVSDLGKRNLRNYQYPFLYPPTPSSLASQGQSTTLIMEALTAPIANLFGSHMGSSLNSTVSNLAAPAAKAYGAELYAGVNAASLNFFERAWMNYYIWIGNPVIATGLMSFVLHGEWSASCVCGNASNQHIADSY